MYSYRIQCQCQLYHRFKSTFYNITCFFLLFKIIINCILISINGIIEKTVFSTKLDDYYNIEKHTNERDGYEKSYRA